MTRSLAPAPPAASGRSRGRLGRDTWWAWWFLAPTILGLAALSAGPIIASFGISLTDWDLLSPAEFVGVENFASLLSNQRFLLALRNTAFYTLTSVPLSLILGLGLALALDQRIRGIAIIRTAYFLPVVTSTTAIALVWMWIYGPQGGLLNAALDVFGIPPQKWIADPFWSMPSIVVMSVWQGIGTTVIILLAGLQGIPQEFHDAASVDGAGRWHRFRHVTVPLLTPTLFFTGILSFIGAFQVFDQVYVLARPGEPTKATITLVYFIYESGFDHFKMGLAAAASWILFLIVAILTILYFRSQSRWVHYQ